METCICGACDHPEAEPNDTRVKILEVVSDLEQVNTEFVKNLELAGLVHDRLGIVRKLVNVLDSSEQILDIVNAYGCAAPIHAAIRTCRDTIENARISFFIHYTCNVLLPEEGVSEDVCYFIAVAACDTRLVHAPNEASLLLSSQKLHYVAFPEVTVQCMTPREVDISFLSVFEHRQRIDWNCASLRKYILALQRRASVLIISHMRGELQFSQLAERRAQWSCEVAVLKQAAIQASMADRVSYPVTSPLFRDWLSATVEKWDGTRLREAVAIAYRRRVLRVGEVGRNRAFGGQSQLRRARGALDVSEELIHSVELPRLAAVPPAECDSLVRTLQDVLIMKIFGNCLEQHQIDFIGNHVVLDSLREMWSSHTLARQNEARPLYICETMGGFTLRGKQVTKQYHFDSFSDVACAWYIEFFGERDPLKINL